MMFDWRGVSADPTNRAATLQLDHFLQSITRVEEISRREMLLDFVRDKTVLDIGAGEHDLSFFSPDWEHGLICGVAKSAVAAEINAELCAAYREKGFDFRCVDATSEADLGERFERVFMGDVIEHVNDAVGLLAFARRHLAPEGRILLTTPNPFAPRYRRSRQRWGTRYVMANLEHTAWVSTSNMHELAFRAGLELRALRWPLLKRPKPGLAGRAEMFAKKCALALAPIETLFVEYAFELGAR
jgi:2-polyprenyl-3-methyl-5-hydroxy-6-metoxy-1,4-benzoquinol methylase